MINLNKLLIISLSALFIIPNFVFSSTIKLQPEIEKLSVYELKQNQSTIKRNFLVDAYVSEIYIAPPCPSDAISCEPSLPPNITISDSYGDIIDTKSSARVWIGHDKKYNFEIGKKYQFEVYVQNISETNVPKNNFNLIDVKNLERPALSIDDKPLDKQNQKTSLITKIWEWFINFFKG